MSSGRSCAHAVCRPHGAAGAAGRVAATRTADCLKGARAAGCRLAGIFTPRAEVTNGRAAMLGFAILLALEYKAGVPFF